MVKKNFLFLFFAISLSSLAGNGADYLEYLKWSKYFNEFDINIFKDYNKSETGLPLSSWYYGSGLLLSIIDKFIFFVNLNYQLNYNQLY